MTTYVALAWVAFDGDDVTDVWAQAQAEWIVDNTQVLAAQSAIVDGVSADERQSWCGAFEMASDGTLTLTKAWHQTDSGPVAGLPADEPGIPVGPGEWQAGVAYTTGQHVMYNDVEYSCLQGHTSQVGWEPPNVPALWAQV